MRNSHIIGAACRPIPCVFCQEPIRRRQPRGAVTVRGDLSVVFGCGPCSDDPRNAGALAALRDIVGDLEGTISGGDDPVHRWQENSTLVYRRLVQFD